MPFFCPDVQLPQFSSIPQSIQEASQHMSKVDIDEAGRVPGRM